MRDDRSFYGLILEGLTHLHVMSNAIIQNDGEIKCKFNFK